MLLRALFSYLLFFASLILCPIEAIAQGKYQYASQRLLMYKDLMDLEDAQLTMMRNEIFARHGSVSTSDLTDIEKVNLLHIRHVEECRTDTDTAIVPRGHFPLKRGKGKFVHKGKEIKSVAIYMQNELVGGGVGMISDYAGTVGWAFVSYADVPSSWAIYNVDVTAYVDEREGKPHNVAMHLEEYMSDDEAQRREKVIAGMTQQEIHAFIKDTVAVIKGRGITPSLSNLSIAGLSSEGYNCGTIELNGKLSSFPDVTFFGDELVGCASPILLPTDEFPGRIDSTVIRTWTTLSDSHLRYFRKLWMKVELTT